MRHSSRFAMLGLVLALAACSSTGENKTEASYPEKPRREAVQSNGSIFGDEGLTLDSKRKRSDGQGIAVNAFLWRATLDTISFMPVSSADPFGGLVLTDWYSPAGAPDERFKLNVAILDKQLRADSVRVAVFHQTRSSRSEWQTAAVDPAMNGQLEELILTRARQLRVQTGPK